MPAVHRILLQASAPPKPPAGAPCNGCGACCAWQPCPLGRWLSRRSTGACVALEWQGEHTRYRCGALATPGRWLPALPPALAGVLVRRWIAAGRGCDAHFDAEPESADDPAHPGLP